MMARRIAALWALAALVSGCATNPVTGENEVMLVSEDTELRTGREQYAPSRQMQGGDFLLDPPLGAYVAEVGQRLVRVSDRKLPYEFSVINDSTPNAWALPGGKIAVNRGLLWELGSEAELAAVLAHEIVHAAARHGAQGMQRGVLLQGALIAAGVATRDSDYSRLAVGAASVGAGLLNQSYSRDAEREADEYGMRYMARAGYDPMAAVELQQTFVRLNERREPNWLSGLFASHPPSPERVELNRRTAAQLGVKGERGEARYRRMSARLRELRPAYEAYDQGRKALAGGETKQALALAEQALGLEPSEALFHGLKGEALARQGRTDEAESAYNRAIDLDPGFFRHYLQRGEVRLKQGRWGEAQADLKRSLALLPTADAHYLLGRLALRGGDQRGALVHFRSAAGSGSDTGRLAAGELVRIQLPDQPQRYLGTRLGIERGWLVVQVSNDTPLAVDRVELLVGRQGQQRGARYRIGRVIPSGGQVRVVTDIRLESREQLPQWRALVRRARIVE